MLLTVEDIEGRLSTKFSAFNGELDDLKLLRPTEPVLGIEQMEKQLGIQLPEDFLSFIMAYNIDNLSLGRVAFGCGKSYPGFIIEMNQYNGFNHWWLGDNRPEGIVVIAISDPYTILLNTLDKRVYAMTSESTMDEFELVATNFNLFIRALGSLFLNTATVDEIRKEVGADSRTEIWQIMAV